MCFVKKKMVLFERSHMSLIIIILFIQKEIVVNTDIHRYRERHLLTSNTNVAALRYWPFHGNVDPQKLPFGDSF